STKPLRGALFSPARRGLGEQRTDFRGHQKNRNRCENFPDATENSQLTKCDETAERERTKSDPGSGRGGEGGGSRPLTGGPCGLCSRKPFLPCFFERRIG